MSQMITTTLTINGKSQTVTALPDTPLLWVLREQLKLTGTKYGCGVGQCGACTVHIDGKPNYACLNPIKDLAGRRVTTIEGLSPDSSHPLQKAWIAEQVPQCGYCQSGQCGACTVHIDGKPNNACLNPIKDLAGRRVTTIEGLSPDSSHPLQKAWIAEQVPQCGYCQSGQIMRAAGLLQENPRPSRQQIVDHMQSNICRCGTYYRIVRAIERAAKEGA